MIPAEPIAELRDRFFWKWIDRGPTGDGEVYRDALADAIVEFLGLVRQPAVALEIAAAFRDRIVTARTDRDADRLAEALSMVEPFEDAIEEGIAARMPRR